MIFEDRRDAGRRLAVQLQRFKSQRPVVLALPRGGVPVGYEVALALGAPLDVIVVRKLGAPGQPELGIGAIVDGDHPQSVLNEELVQELHVSRGFLEREIASELAEVHRRQTRYRGGRPPLSVAGRTVLVVDDGIATGSSMRAALRGVRRAGPSRLVLAVPVAPPDTIEALRAEVDDIVCLSTPAWFGAVGNFYRDFDQTTDEEVIRLLDAARQRAAEDTARVELVS
ncbi:MAG TPA: phosphoribosyltransferase [Candidatus Kryptonia bacterium]|nr:phosphoribosyltransferase [Candidatus Kryptonia bacterium]